MKKKIAFVIATFMIGGQEKALISMLNKIPRDKYDITILTLFDEGELKRFVPDWIKIKVIPKSNSNVKHQIIEEIKNIKLIDAIKDIYYTINIKKSKTKAKKNYYTAKLYPKLEEKYDVIIHYHSTESFILHYVALKTEAKAKIAWIHSDISENLSIDRNIFRDIYSRYDKIFSVSQASLIKFKQYLPEFGDIIELFYNIVDSDEINRLSQEYKAFNDEYKGLNILTVGRLCIDKGQEVIPQLVKKLINEGYNIRWYLVGDGDTRTLIQENIDKLSIHENLILTGSKINPYPYIKDCDVYVQPSVSEGLCISLFEARCLNRPIVATDFNGAREQIRNGHTGYIVPINNVEELYLKIKKLLENEKIRNKFSYNLSKENPSNIDELQKLYKFIDNI